MAKWVNLEVLDGGLNAIKNGATKLHVIASYSLNDTYATIVSNTLAEVPLISDDFSISGTSNRTLELTSGKSAVAAADSIGTDLHIAFTDGTSKVLWVTDETSNATFSAGATITFPAIAYTSNQPAA